MPPQRSTQRRGPEGGSAQRTVSRPQRVWVAFGGTQRLLCSRQSLSRRPRARLHSPWLSAVGSGQRQAIEAGTGALWLHALPLLPGRARRTLSAEQRWRTTAAVRHGRPGPRGNGGLTARRRRLTSPLPQRMQAASQHVTGGARVQHRVGQLAQAVTAMATARCLSRARAVPRDILCVVQLCSHRQHAVGGGRCTLPIQVSIAMLVNKSLHCS